MRNNTQTNYVQGAHGQGKTGKMAKKIPCREKSGNLKILFNIRENTGNLKISKKYQGKRREFNFTKNKFY